MQRTYYTINEQTARTARELNSFSGYKDGEATEVYRQHVDSVYDIVERIAEEKPNLLERAERMVDRYSRKLAEYYNSYYRNEASCPSIMISGGSNFPTGKKNKQNSRRDSLMNDWNYLEDYAKKIEHLLTKEQPIMSGDEDAVERLDEKLADLQELQDRMKAVNAYYRKNQTLDGCPDLSDAERNEIEQMWARGWCEGVPYPAYSLQNNNGNIKRTRDRLESLKKKKEAGTQKAENQFCKVVKNTEIMRLQLFFDGKPEEEIRNILKSNGFRWAPSQNAWQRQLTANGEYALNRVLEELKKLETTENEEG